MTQLTPEQKDLLRDHPDVIRAMLAYLEIVVDSQVDRLSTTPADPGQLLIARSELQGMRNMINRVKDLAKAKA